MFGRELNPFKCEYKGACPDYRGNSNTCNVVVDKTYCGAYKQFLKGDEE